MLVAEIRSSSVENLGDEASHFSNIGSCGCANAESALESCEKVIYYEHDVSFLSRDTPKIHVVNS